jgi:hypothetical protein
MHTKSSLNFVTTKSKMHPHFRQLGKYKPQKLHQSPSINKFEEVMQQDISYDYSPVVLIHKITAISRHRQANIFKDI